MKFPLLIDISAFVCYNMVTKENILDKLYDRNSEKEN